MTNVTHELDSVFPAAPGGRHVVLHTRVITGTGGGPDKTILLSAPFMSGTPYWLVAAYLHPPDDPGFHEVQNKAVQAGCPLIAVPDAGPLDCSVFRVLLDLCRRYKVRIWHGHDYKSNLLGLAVRPFWNMKLVTTVHGWVKRTAKTPLYYAIDRWCLPYYHRVICVSPDLIDRARTLGVPDERLSLVFNAIDESRFKRHHPPDQARLRLQYQVPPGRVVMGAVGRLSTEKGFCLLIRAVHALVERGLDLELWIAGEGDQRGDLEDMVERYDLAGRVRLLGFVEDTISLYHALDLFVLSSLREGLPNVVLEAMSMHVPVVVTQVGGVGDLIQHEQTGLICTAGELDALIEACQRLVTDKTLRRRLAMAGRKAIESHYSFGQRMDQIRHIYDNVLGIPKPNTADSPSSA
ncbi:MAG: glycosyl transferase family 1 [Phycisphaeraceae bacterium]|nr:glycosyl transferase family 1 [Phycisphaeraceae bacterium]